MHSVFSFAGRSDIDLGVKVTAITRPVKPVKRNVQTIIPGRSGTYIYSDGCYEDFVISMECMYTGTDPAGFRRQLAEWLGQSSDLVFANEPDKYYSATVWSDIPGDYVMSLRHFTLNFQCSPFARSAIQQATGVISAAGGAVAVQVQGTAPTPCKIVITNTGETTIHRLVITPQMAAMAFSNYLFNRDAPFNRAELATDSGNALTLGTADSPYTFTFAPGDVLVIDSETLTVTLNGVEDVSAWVVGSEFPALTKGLNLLQFAADGTGWELGVEVYWADRWL